ncbi:MULTISPECIES: reverse transcriptase domain-containing protein [Bradyrhizobium]|uniref:reverse transcriptase domain-containing protein n=1 Tax=Bradyrhizobium TaxID=374 RepID=UPI001FED412C|nr:MULTISPECIES: reverse transcriptase domain-containing protein [unclassified Bradyrhizobium]
MSKQLIEPALDAIFLADTYGYRPGKSALDAVGVTRQRCWKYDWVLEFDIKGLFDNIDRELLLRAVRKHVTCAWALLYIERWLTAPMVQEDGTIIERSRGTPQGGVVSPILANLFMHYAFDLWMARMFPDLRWCRYADDGLVHCRNEMEAQSVASAAHCHLRGCELVRRLLDEEAAGFIQCGSLRRANNRGRRIAHPQKTRRVANLPHAPWSGGRIFVRALRCNPSTEKTATANRA